MAQPLARFKDNIPGKYYVDENCIACDACCIEAPNFFVMNDDEGHAFVKIQPKTAAELADCENALSACPVDAIGRDG